MPPPPLPYLSHPLIDVLISFSADEYIMTAAHCVLDFTTFEVVMGAVEIMNLSEDGRMETTTTTSFLHPDYDNVTFANDIAFLQVDKINFNGTGICYSYSYLFSNFFCTHLGYPLNKPCI